MDWFGKCSAVVIAWTRPGAFVTVTRALVTRDTASVTFAPRNIALHGTVPRTTSSTPHDKKELSMSIPDITIQKYLSHLGRASNLGIP